MAKVILLNSSPRANSNTQDVLEVCAEEIEKNGVEAEIISLEENRYSHVLHVTDVQKQEIVF